MKITTSTEEIKSFDRFNFCYQHLKDKGISLLIDNHLGQRGEFSSFNYSDMFMNHLAIFLNGGDCAEDLQEHFGASLREVRGLSVCSADTLLRGIKELACPTEEVIYDSG